MKFFDLPYDPLSANLAPSLDIKTLRRFSCTSRRAREVFYPLAICYDTDDADQFQIIINQLIFAIIHSETMFAQSELRNKTYEKLKQTKNQNQKSVPIRFLRYLLLLILNTHYHMGTPGEAHTHELRIIYLLKYMNSRESRIYTSLYYSKFNKSAELDELRVSIGKFDSSNSRLMILYQMLILKQHAQSLIQDIINAPLHGIMKSGKPINSILSIINVPINQPFNYDKLMPFLHMKYSALYFMDVILKCEDLHEHPIEFLYSLYSFMLARLVNFNMKISKENEFIDEYISQFIKTILTILDRIDKIFASLKKNQQYNILFHIAGLSLENEVNEMVCQYIYHHLDLTCFENKEFVEKLSVMNEKSKKSDLYCLFAFKKLFPNSVHVNTNFIIDWRISKTSVLNFCSNEPLISLCHCPLTSDQTIALYDRLNEHLRKHNKIQEPYNPDESRYGRLNYELLRHTNIEQVSVFYLLSLIYLKLDPSQCLEIISLIVDIAYGNKFKGLLERNDTHLSPVMSHLCSKISNEEKLKLANNIMLRIRNEANAYPNLLVHFIDDFILKSILKSKMKTKDKLHIIDHIDLEKISHENLHYLLNKLLHLIGKIIKGESRLGSTCEDYARWIWKLENYIPWDNRDIAKTIIKFLKGFILLFNGKITNTSFGWIYEKYFTLDRYFLILKNRIDENSYFSLVIDFLCNDKFPQEESMAFVIRNITSLFSQHEQIPTKWMEKLIPLINSDKKINIRLSIEIMTELLLNDLITMDNLLFFQLKVAIENLLNKPYKYKACKKLLIIAARYYPVTDLIDWIILLTSEHKLSMKSIMKEILSVPLSIDDLTIFMAFHDQKIRYLAYYYLSMNKPKMSEHQCNFLFEHITHCLDLKIAIPTSIISLLAYYQTPKHYSLTSTIVKKLLFENQMISVVELIEHEKFCKLIRPLLEIFDETTKLTIFDIIIEHIESKPNSDKNEELLANLSELIPIELLSIEPEYLPQGWINL